MKQTRTNSSLNKCFPIVFPFQISDGFAPVVMGHDTWWFCGTEENKGDRKWRIMLFSNELCLRIVFPVKEKGVTKSS